MLILYAFYDVFHVENNICFQSRYTFKVRSHCRRTGYV